jgi:nucleoside-diphosphate-sugar epimerase
MTFVPHRVAIVGATGPTGYHLARELVGRGRAVRALSRSRERLEAWRGDLEVEIATADALDADSLRSAVGGYDLVVDCIGLPPEHMEDHPRVARAVVGAADAVGARCLQVSSYWSFLPHRTPVVDESHPRQGGHAWFRLRRAAEDVFLASGAAVVHLPDFFGPRVRTSSVQLALEDAVAGRPMSWIGGGEVGREAAYVPDVMRIVADLMEREEAYGTDWGLPGCGVLTATDLARLAGEHLGREVRLRTAPPWLLKVIALFSREMRPVVPIATPYSQPVRYETSKLQGLLGALEVTPPEAAVGATLDWIEGRAEVDG